MRGDLIKTFKIIILFTNPSARAGYDTSSIFKRSLTGLNQSFPSPRLVASSRQKNPVCPTIYPQLDSYLSQGYQCYVKCNQSRSGFELVSPCPFPTTITITPRAPPNTMGIYFIMPVCRCSFGLIVIVLDSYPFLQSFELYSFYIIHFIFI